MLPLRAQEKGMPEQMDKTGVETIAIFYTRVVLKGRTGQSAKWKCEKELYFSNHTLHTGQTTRSQQCWEFKVLSSRMARV